MIILTIFIVVRGFLAAVMKGQIPDELVKEAKGGEVNVDMEDHRDEEFEKAKVKAKPFGGAGNVLGSIAPSVAAPETSASLDPAAAEKSAQAAVSLSEASPVASIQVHIVTTALWEPRPTSPATSLGGFESNFKGSRGLPSEPKQDICQHFCN